MLIFDTIQGVALVNMHSQYEIISKNNFSCNVKGAFLMQEIFKCLKNPFLIVKPGTCVSKIC